MFSPRGFFISIFCAQFLFLRGQVNYATDLGPNDNRDSGLVTGRTLTFTKISDETPLHVTYTDNFRVASSAQGVRTCYWRVLIDGAECPSGDLRYDRYTDSQSSDANDKSNNHDASTVEGICENISSGTHTIEIEVGNPVPGRSETGDCFTGWFNGRWIILTEEIGFELEDGTPGSDGAKGDQGEQGPPGAQGPQGVTGSKGEPGTPGEDGEDGVDGAKGDPGQQGLPGAIGPQGTIGEPGTDGAKGEPGTPGDDGVPGFSGLPGIGGEPGEIGPVGPPGMEGEPGEKGDKGDSGDVGPPGLPGQDGSPGDHGIDGIDGTPGEDGTGGAKGEPGDVGPPGLPGQDGQIGDSGEPGAEGPPGPPGLPAETTNVEELEEMIYEIKNDQIRMSAQIDLILMLLTGSSSQTGNSQK